MTAVRRRSCNRKAESSLGDGSVREHKRQVRRRSALVPTVRSLSRRTFNRVARRSCFHTRTSGTKGNCDVPPPGNAAATSRLLRSWRPCETGRKPFPPPREVRGNPGPEPQAGREMNARLLVQHHGADKMSAVASLYHRPDPPGGPGSGRPGENLQARTMLQTAVLESKGR